MQEAQTCTKQNINKYVRNWGGIKIYLYKNNILYLLFNLLPN